MCDNPDANSIRSPCKMQNLRLHSPLRRSLSPVHRMMPMQRIPNYTVSNPNFMRTVDPYSPLAPFNFNTRQMNPNIHSHTQPHPIINPELKPQSPLNYNQPSPVSPVKPQENLNETPLFQDEDKVLYPKREIENLLNELISWRNMYYKMEEEKKEVEAELEKAKARIPQPKDSHCEGDVGLYSNITNLMNQLRLKEQLIQELNSRLLEVTPSVHKHETSELLLQKERLEAHCRETQAALEEKEHELALCQASNHRFSAVVEEMKGKLASL